MLTATGAKVVDFGIAALGVGPEAGGGLGRRHAGLCRPRAARSWCADTGVGCVRPGRSALRDPHRAATARCNDLGGGRARARATGWPTRRLSVPGLPEAVRLLCERCLSGSPERRPASEEAAVILAAVAGRPSGHNSGGVGHGAFATVGPTLLDPATVPMVPRAEHPTLDRGCARGVGGEAGLGRSAPPAARRRVGGRGRPPRGPLGGQRRDATGRRRPAGRRRSRHAEPVGRRYDGRVDARPSHATPDEPATTSRRRSVAIEAQIAAALDSGQIDDDMARDLADDLRELRERLERGRIKDLQKRAERLRNRLEDARPGRRARLGLRRPARRPAGAAGSPHRGKRLTAQTRWGSELVRVSARDVAAAEAGPGRGPEDQRVRGRQRYAGRSPSQATGSRSRSPNDIHQWVSR